MNSESMVKKAYSENFNMSNGFCSKIKVLLGKLGFQHVWENQNTMSKTKLLFSFQKKLEEEFIKSWNQALFCDSNKDSHGNKLRTYRKVKNNFELEKYLLLDLNKSVISKMVKIRISNSKLLIEVGRYTRTPLEQRICPLCKDGIEDEFHFLIKCKALEFNRSILFCNLSDIVPSFANMSDQDKFSFILKSNDTDICTVCVAGISDMYDSNIHLKQTQCC